MSGEKQNPTVSVIVPMYNRARWVGMCVASVLAQTFQDVELIVVDDGSTDGSVAEVLRVCGDRRVRVLAQRNRGVSVARNRGLDAARGAFVYFMDSDDFIHPQLLERCVGALRAEPGAAFAHFELRSVPEDSPGAGEVFREPLGEMAWARWEDPFEDFLASLRHVGPPLWVYRREALRGLRFEPGLEYEDDLFAYRFIRRARRGLYSPRAMYGYRVLANSLCHHPFRAGDLPHWARIVRLIVRDYAEDPARLERLGRMHLRQVALAIMRKQSRRSGDAATLLPLACALIGGLLADGSLRWRWFPWRKRALLFFDRLRYGAIIPADDARPCPSAAFSLSDFLAENAAP